MECNLVRNHVHHGCWNNTSFYEKIYEFFECSSNLYRTWTEVRAIWSEIIRVISKSDERAARVRFEIRPKLHDLKFNCHFITSILKSHNLIALIQDLLEQQKLTNLPNNNLFVFHFPAMWLAGLKNLEIWLVVLFYSLILIGCEKDVI